MDKLHGHLLDSITQQWKKTIRWHVSVWCILLAI